MKFRNKKIEKKLGEIPVFGVDVCTGSLPDNVKLKCVETSDMLYAYALTDGETVYGYVRNSEYAYIKVIICRGDEIYFVKSREELGKNNMEYYVTAWIVTEK